MITSGVSRYRLAKPSPADLAALLESASNHDFSYRPIGRSLQSSEPPPAFHGLHVRRNVGVGRLRFDQVKDAIEQWAGHRRARAVLHPSKPELVAGTDVALGLRVGPIWVTAVCRIVEVVDEPDRFGFAYGTLPDHPESGEESFLVIHDAASDQVRVQITAYSRPVALLAKLGGPFGRLFQRFMANRYVDGFAHSISDEVPPSPLGVDVTSVRWWLENRRTGEITVAQFPNWPLFAIVGVVAVSSVVGPGHPFHGAADAGVRSLWLYWGADELVRGVNPWRRLLGAGVLGWQVAGLLGGS